ncbi:hypothetical protein B5G20_04220 [Collinsella sp. An7]|uniref:NYN domain-containing protein n=1 Tax=Collinsella sp. An7 TaxID=1965651 RepID=UPI000B37E912|nr:NYN domain-containing protein [Collinsella sp. An7]OUN47189.1 hypothetical protein B5G20_04220 [Collinsella sp. An7]
MASTLERDLRFAILIDADNIAPKYIKIILDEVSNLGIATYKRIYGDWTSQRLMSWKGVLLENSIIPMQQYSYTYGKSSTDSAMIIDAMDILYSGHVDGFAIVSSDSDFTRLAARLRESGMQVIGMGEQKTPEPFISACNQFKYLDLLYAARKAEEADADDTDADDASEASAQKQKRRKKTVKKRERQGIAANADESAEEPEPESDASDLAQAEDSSAPEVSEQRPRRRPGDAGGEARATEETQATAEVIDFAEMSRAARRNHMKRIRTTVNAIIDKFSDDEGWVALGRVGDELSKRLPDFDVRNYGFKKLRPFLKSLGVYEFDEPDAASGQRQIYLRLREED